MKQEKTRLPKKAWSIKTYKGSSPFDLHPIDGEKQGSLTMDDITDIPATFVADPFMIKKDGTWYMFMEILNGETGLGEIGLAESVDGTEWNYKQVVLKEDYHLSYSFVFEEDGDYYMIPETLDAKGIRLYKASNFPLEWELESTLIDGVYADPTVFKKDDKWWMFAASSPYQSNTLNLFYADSLKGPYTEHPQSPIIENNKQHARPAGRVIDYNDQLIRLCQDCYPMYGSAVRVFEIKTLTTEAYSEVQLEQSPILKASSEAKQWNTRGMHHLDVHKIGENEWMACVDGCYNDDVVIRKRAVWIFDENYKAPTFLSVASFREHVNIPITLIFYGSPDQELLDTFQRLEGNNEVIIKPKMTSNTRSDRHKENRLARMEIMTKWPDEQVIVMDGDFIFSEKIKELIPSIDKTFERLDSTKSVVLGVEEYDQKFFTEQRNEKGESHYLSPENTEACLEEVYGNNWKQLISGVQFNNGFLVMYNCATLADHWKKNYLIGLQHNQVNPEDDQLPLCVSMYECDTQAAQLDEIYNSLGRLSGDYAAYHAWNGKWRNELEKIVYGESEATDYSRIANEMIKKMPRSWYEGVKSKVIDICEV